jgi:hypothetical protein
LAGDAAAEFAEAELAVGTTVEAVELLQAATIRLNNITNETTTYFFIF